MRYASKVSVCLRLGCAVDVEMRGTSQSQGIRRPTQLHQEDRIGQHQKVEDGPEGAGSQAYAPVLSR